MKGLFLYGVNCTCEIWSPVQKVFSDYDIEYVEYPHIITETANCVSDITEWVFATYGDESYDFVVGHSMGGIVALELTAEYNLPCHQIILVETNLKPANMFYRNLLMPEHMKDYGNKLLELMKKEALYYQEPLKKSLQEDFDYTKYIQNVHQDIYAIFGDRGQKGYVNRISDLCLDNSVLNKINFSFVENACHMPMIENPAAFADIIAAIISNK